MPNGLRRIAGGSITGNPLHLYTTCQLMRLCTHEVHIQDHPCMCTFFKGAVTRAPLTRSCPDGAPLGQPARATRGGCTLPLARDLCLEKPVGTLTLFTREPDARPVRRRWPRSDSRPPFSGSPSGTPSPAAPAGPRGRAVLRSRAARCRPTAAPSQRTCVAA